MQTRQANWKVLLIGGSSGVGKTVAARKLGQRLGASWLQVDDLRLALLRSRVTLPEKTYALYFFQNHAAWNLPPEQFCEGLIAVGELMSPAIEVVIENHVDTHAPVIIEGDAILPSLVARPEVQRRMQNGQVQAVFLVEPEEDVLLSNILARGRGIDRYTVTEAQTEARAKWLYGQWLAREAQRLSLPVLESRPWETLVERIEAIIPPFQHPLYPVNDSEQSPTKRMAAAALFLNKKHEILVVKPTYRDLWLLPGGVVEYGESPRQACMREIREELGLTIAAEKLLCVDYKVQHGMRKEGIEFVFFGGVLADEMIGQIRLQEEELEEARFVSIEEATTLLNPWTARRVPHAVRALREGITIYLEDGRTV